jgi:hypothetical protein
MRDEEMKSGGSLLFRKSLRPRGHWWFEEVF